jgi:hypothetical protein
MKKKNYLLTALFSSNDNHINIYALMYSIYISEPDSSVSILVVSGYGLEDRTIEVRSPAGAKDFSCSLCVQTGSGGPPSLL